MKRILIWFLILIIPVSVWFSFTEDGNDAFQMWFVNANTEQLELSEYENIKINDQITLIPANKINKVKARLPYLHIELKGRNTASRKIPAGLLLVDSEGRRTGYDSINDKYFQEIPNSKYEIKLTPRTTPPSDIAVINIEPAQPQYYRIEVIGHKDENYALSVSRNPSMASRTLMAMPSHYIHKGELHSYSVDMNKSPIDTFISSMAKEPFSASFSKEKNISLEKVDNADMKLDIALPDIELKNQLHISNVLSYGNKYAFNILYPKTDKMKENLNGAEFSNGEDTVVVKVLPHKNDPFNYSFNKTHSTLQSFASIALPSSIGLSADGDGYSIHPVGITGTKAFTNANNVSGISTFVVHEVRRYEHDENKSEKSYELQGPVYVFILNLGRPVSPILVVSPYGPMDSNFATDPQRVWDIANSVELIW